MDVCPRFSVLCCPVCRYLPCVGLIPRPRSPTKCPYKIHKFQKNNFWTGTGQSPNPWKMIIGLWNAQTQSAMQFVKEQKTFFGFLVTIPRVLVTFFLSEQVHSDSDINLDTTGSFKRFDPVDRDFRVAITTSSLMGSYGGSPPPSASIPPQPLRPAPAPAPVPSRPAPPPPPPPAERPPEAAETLLADVTTVSPAIVPADDPESGEQLPPTLQRAMSCDSVCSDTSVVLGDLEEPNVTGYLCVGLEYDRCVPLGALSHDSLYFFIFN
jgi:hypothetical protein